MVFSAIGRTLSRVHYAWIIVAVTFAVVVVSAGVRATPGVLIVPLGRPSSLTTPVSVTVLTGNVTAVRSAVIATVGGWLVPAGLTVMVIVPVPVKSESDAASCKTYVPATGKLT